MHKDDDDDHDDDNEEGYNNQNNNGDCDDSIVGDDNFPDIMEKGVLRYSAIETTTTTTGNLSISNLPPVMEDLTKGHSIRSISTASKSERRRLLNNNQSSRSSRSIRARASLSGLL